MVLTSRFPADVGMALLLTPEGEDALAYKQGAWGRRGGLEEGGPSSRA